MITKHVSGLIEINTLEGLFVLTDEEYQRAKRRGESVIRNRNHSKAMKEILQKFWQDLQGPSRGFGEGTEPTLEL